MNVMRYSAYDASDGRSDLAEDRIAVGDFGFSVASKEIDSGPVGETDKQANRGPETSTRSVRRSRSHVTAMRTAISPCVRRSTRLGPGDLSAQRMRAGETDDVPRGGVELRQRAGALDAAGRDLL